jgi:hypothetical protein
MMTYVVGWSGIALVAGIIVLLDYLGERQQRRAKRPLAVPVPHLTPTISGLDSAAEFRRRASDP